MTPSETAQAFFTALDRHDWRLAAGLLDPNFAEQLRGKEIARLLGRAKRLDELGLAEDTEGSLGYNPAYTPDLLAAFGGTPVYNLPGATTVAELVAMPDQSFLEAYLSISSRWRPEFEEAPDAIPVREVISEEAGEKPDEAIVFYRYAIPGVVLSGSQPSHRLRLHRTSRGWRITWVADPRPPEFIQFADLGYPDDSEAAG